MKHTEGRIVLKCDLEGKNSHKFEDGTVIRLERQYNQFNQRIAQPVNATVVSADGMKEGYEILIGHNSICESNKIYDSVLSGEEMDSSVQLYSIPYLEAFLYREGVGQEWKPLKGFATALRIFHPYTGSLEGVFPTEIKNMLYITSGEFKGKVVYTLKASDYEIIYQGDDGREKRVIRLRHFEDEINEREEITCLHEGMSRAIKKGDYYVGLTKEDCKPLK
jgi:hypothetical protein